MLKTIKKSTFFILILIAITTLHSCNFQKIVARNKVKGIKKLQLNVKRFKSSDGCEMVYADNEQKNLPVLFFIHGFGVDMQNFFPLAKLFQENGDSVRMVFVDLPGFGWSYDKSDTTKVYDCKISSQAKRLAELIQELHLTNVHLISTSMGGAIALTLNAQLPNGIIKSNTSIAPFGMSIYTQQLPEMVSFYLKTGKLLLLIDNNFLDYTPQFIEMLTNKKTNFLLKGLAKKALKEVMMPYQRSYKSTLKDIVYDDQQIQKIFLHNQELKDKMIDAKIDTNMSYSPISNPQQFKEMLQKINKISIKNIDPVGTSFEPIDTLLPKINNPVLVIWGTKDKVIHYKTTDNMKPLLKKGYYVFDENGAHSISRTKPALTYQSIKKMWKDEHLVYPQTTP